MIQLAGYYLMQLLIPVLCRVYEWLHSIITAFGQGLLQAIGAVDAILDAICGTVSQWPIIGFVARAICVAVEALFDATAGIVNGIVIVTGFLIRFAVATTFSVAIMAGMLMAWFLQWALGRTVDWGLCLHQEDKEPRKLRMRFIVLDDSESLPFEQQALDRYAAQTIETLQRECEVYAAVETGRLAAPSGFKPRGITRAAVWLDPFAFLGLACIARNPFRPVIFFVDSLADDPAYASGVAFPVLTSFAFVPKGSPVGGERHTPAHEFGHLCDAWQHPQGEDLIMNSPPFPQARRFLPDERCYVRSARFCRVP